MLCVQAFEEEGEEEGEGEEGDGAFGGVLQQKKRQRWAAAEASDDDDEAGESEWLSLLALAWLPCCRLPVNSCGPCGLLHCLG